MKKYAITAIVFVVFAVLMLGAGALVEPRSAVLAVQDNSPCPVTACASGECHGFGNVPEPDGVTEMVCPEAGCASVECHAWDTLAGRYHQASDASLNLWILMPVALVVTLVALVRGLSRKEKAARRDAAASPLSSVPDGSSKSEMEAGDPCE
ncbi:hypothetical protein [uncultured Adlercreutzia sp.]|uniref:hypothetical protein n=1 Tax=uncultured Adlercreutzia sp. TaxID=875803 RepID=UPI0026F3FE51|nr:hypothetical protein [uncultured Adlercreutzia sp.]